MRVALAGAFLTQPDLLILDEPSNHLDGPQRQRLMDRLQARSGGLVVISHDRSLLEAMQRILELSAHGLRSYGGNYAFYARQRVLEQQAAGDLLAQCKHARARGEQALREQQLRQQQRQARGARTAGQANHAPIPLGRQKQRSQVSAGQRQAEQARLSEAVVQAQRMSRSIGPSRYWRRHRRPVRRGGWPRCSRCNWPTGGWAGVGWISCCMGSCGSAWSAPMAAASHRCCNCWPGACSRAPDTARCMCRWRI